MSIRTLLAAVSPVTIFFPRFVDRLVADDRLDFTLEFVFDRSFILVLVVLGTVTDGTGICDDRLFITLIDLLGVIFLECLLALGFDILVVLLLVVLVLLLSLVDVSSSLDGVIVA